jgi:NADH:ubiquinone oxidoreductase subunit D
MVVKFIDRGEVLSMDDGHAVMLMNEIRILTQEVKNLNTHLSKIASSTEEKGCFSEMYYAINYIAKNLNN